MTLDERERLAAALAEIGDDPEILAELMLFVRALKRHDDTLVRGLQELAGVPRRDGPPVELTDDELAVARRIAAICDREEGLSWGRALAGACRRGDRLRASLLLDLAGERCAA